MIKCFCDICGNPATIGMYALRYSVFVTTESLHLYDHHLCHCCAEKIGIVDHIKARQIDENGRCPECAEEEQARIEKEELEENEKGNIA